MINKYDELCKLEEKKKLLKLHKEENESKNTVIPEIQ